MKKVVNIKYAKSREYKKTLETIEKTAECPFCKDNFKYHKKKILKKKSGWFITESSWPYKNAKFHFLAICEKHKEEFRELTSRDFSAVSKLIKWVIEKYKIKGGCLALRFGDSDYTGATVCHLHFHLIAPKVDRKKNGVKVVNFPIG